MMNIAAKAAFTALLATGLASLTSAQVIVAHRGASADAPENTLSAFRLAWKHHADAIEGDFRLTADGEVACIHDETTKRTAETDLVVASSTLEELQALDVGRWKDPRFAGERIPTLADVLAIVPKDKILFIEIKSGPETLPAVKKAVEQTKLTSANLRIISFKREVIRHAKLSMPDIEAYWLLEFKWNKELKHWRPTAEHAIGVASEIGADGMDVKANAAVLTDDFVRLCEQAGFSKHAYTVDDPEIARQIRALEYDSITTNRPAFLRQALRLPVRKTVPQSKKTPGARTVGASGQFDSQ